LSGMSNMSKALSVKQMDGSGLKIGIVVSRWNEEVTSVLQKRCEQALRDSGVKKSNIFIVHAPGSFELPLAAKKMIGAKKVDAVVCLGCLIKGETMHFEYIAMAVSQGIMNVGLETGVPAIFGVLACLDVKQAKERAFEKGRDFGYEWGLSAVEAGLLKKSIRGLSPNDPNCHSRRSLPLRRRGRE